MRVRLAALYGGLFLASGAVLLGLVYLLVRNTLTPRSIIEGIPEPKPPWTGELPAPPAPPPPAVSEGALPGLARSARDTALNNLLFSSALALVVLVLLSVLCGWWVAGRILRRLHRITATARQLSGHDLDRRVRITGPDDELKELADTFDEMLSRLDGAFEAQRRFAANAAHELRTPLAIERTAIQVGLDDPAPDELRQVREQLLETNRRSQRLIDGLLVLARSDGGLTTREPADLAAIVTKVVDDHRADALAGGIAVRVDALPARVSGDVGLLEQLVGNLVRNAIQYNHPGGHVRVRTITPPGLEVSNTGPVIAAAEVDRLFEPFRRGGPDRVGSADGTGLGLSIVRAIANAHGGAVTATPDPAGGLTVRITLPDG
ncbi:sensor histidine kinase [Amycolatopsis anabasis]|uniref:sensor histidine kinase n=1 Tax=Amycolatopsis anabasis TaxID=1840409 RepID=UPI001FE9467D|nr:HAMP domain-containing sensor histidine kinase [Amycolatopsis anabasis]